MTSSRHDQIDPVVVAALSDGASSPVSAAVVAPEARAVSSAGAGDQWQQLASARRTPDGEREMIAYLEDLATREPQRAMALALAEGNYRLNQNLRGAVLRGWASVSPDEAAAWALARPDGERQLSVEFVFAGAARLPELALKLATRLCANEPALAGDYGQYLIHGLTELGTYDAAARFAAENKNGGQDACLNLAYSEWAAHEPEQALAAFEKISNPQLRSFAFQGLIQGWVMANPATAAAYAERLAPGDERAQVINQALPQWACRDPLAASEWMLKHIEPGPELDAGAATVAAMPNLVNQRPEMAVNWAENIAEPALRANTLRVIGQQWAHRDPAAPRRFIENNPGLAPADRKALQEGMETPAE